MANQRNDVGVLDREISAPVLISEIGTSEGRNVAPELVDCVEVSGIRGRLCVGAIHTSCQSSRGTLSHTQRSRTRFDQEASTSGRAFRQVLLDEIDDCIQVSMSFCSLP